MTQVWPVFGEAPVPGLTSWIFSAEGVVRRGWALAGVRMAGTIAAIAGTAASVSRRVRTRILFSSQSRSRHAGLLGLTVRTMQGFACPCAVVDSTWVNMYYLYVLHIGTYSDVEIRPARRLSPAAAPRCCADEICRNRKAHRWQAACLCALSRVVEQQRFQQRADEGLARSRLQERAGRYGEAQARISPGAPP